MSENTRNLDLRTFKRPDTKIMVDFVVDDRETLARHVTRRRIKYDLLEKFKVSKAGARMLYVDNLQGGKYCKNQLASEGYILIWERKSSAHLQAAEEE